VSSTRRLSALGKSRTTTQKNSSGSIGLPQFQASVTVVVPSETARPALSMTSSRKASSPPPAAPPQVFSFGRTKARRSRQKSATSCGRMLFDPAW